jgi:purine nucleoside phosphorylase
MYKSEPSANDIRRFPRGEILIGIKGHRRIPSEINFRAGICGFKKVRTEWIISAGTVGSMKEERKTKEILIPDRSFDRTRGRESTFFGRGIGAHVSFADPTCPDLGETLYRAVRGVGRPSPTRCPAGCDHRELPGFAQGDGAGSGTLVGRSPNEV